MNSSASSKGNNRHTDSLRCFKTRQPPAVEVAQFAQIDGYYRLLATAGLAIMRFVGSVLAVRTDNLQMEVLARRYLPCVSRSHRRAALRSV